MSKEVLNQEVLRLNKHWQVIGVCTVRKALEDISAGAVTALRFSEGYPTPYRWEDWIHIPVENGQDAVRTARSQVLAPRVVVCVHFNKLIVKPPKLSMKALRKRDNDTCAYTLKKLKPSEMSMEHVVPQSKGGKTHWENIVLAHRDVNSRRGNLPLETVGLQLHVKPHAPRGRQPHELITEIKHPEWKLFLKN
jgi:5-methylcytosine-specific restriction endonuclease McrA